MKKNLTLIGIFAVIAGILALAFTDVFQKKHPENYVELTQNLMELIDTEFDATIGLDKEHIKQIRELSATFIPYEMSTEEDVLYSPGRGHLLTECVKRNFSNADYDKIFKVTNFGSAYLENANLENAYLNGLRASNATFKKADLSKARLTHATLSKGIFEDSNLMESKLDNSIMTGVQFQGANLNRTQFNNTYLVDANFTNTQQVGTVYNKANTSGAIFDERLVNVD